MQLSNKVSLPARRGSRIAPPVALLFWVLCALLFVLFSPGSSARLVISAVAYWAAALFAAVALARAFSGARGRERLFWGLLGAGLIAGFVGDLGWFGMHDPGLAAGGFSYQYPVYLLSYLLFAGALLALVDTTADRITLVTALDSVAIMVSVGTLMGYFFVGPATAVAGLSPADLAALSWPLFDAALVFLCLVTLSTVRRPAFAGSLACGFLAVAVADGLYLRARAEGLYQVGGWPDLFWALGLLLFGCAALRPGIPASSEQSRINPWRIFSFWLGPLSPPVHLAVVFVWAVFVPPIPSYAGIAGAAVLLYMALRVALVSFVSRSLGREREETARAAEQSRLLYELHDTVKQNVHGISLTLQAALDAERRSEGATSREMLEHALETSREAEFQISRPYDELQSSRRDTQPSAEEFFRHRLKKFEEYFGVQTHDDLQASLAGLSPAQIATVTRIIVESFWNVAKHSGARNMYLESRKVGTLLIIRIRDDGRGFDQDNPPPGLGLEYMRRRAAEVGASLDVISVPGRGTTVQLRFEKV